jgi:uncharacterized protein YaiI (UPF0178 family)
MWVDADACPGPIREIIFRAADRRRVETTFVANRPLRLPRSSYLHVLVVESGFDVADERIVENVAPGDLVITADIPLAAQVVAAGATALNPRGTLYTEDTIDEHLSRRDLMDELRSTGVVTGGPPPMGKSAVQAFANALDRYLTRHAGA